MKKTKYEKIISDAKVLNEADPKEESEKVHGLELQEGLHTSKLRHSSVLCISILSMVIGILATLLVVCIFFGKSAELSFDIDPGTGPTSNPSHFQDSAQLSTIPKNENLHSFPSPSKSSIQLPSATPSPQQRSLSIIGRNPTFKPSTAPSMGVSILTSEPSRAPHFQPVDTVLIDISYGGTFNRVLSIQNGCFYALKHNLNLQITESEKNWGKMNTLEELDTNVLQTDCNFVKSGQSIKPKTRMEGSEVFYLYNGYDDDVRDSVSMSIIPAKKTRDEVEQWIAKTFDPTKTLVGVHARWLGGECAIRMSKFCKDKDHSRTNGREICLIDGQIVERILRGMGVQNYEIFLASDGERPRNWSPLESVIKQQPSDWNILYDAWALAHVDVLITNPVSSICITVQSWMRHFKSDPKIYSDHCN